MRFYELFEALSGDDEGLALKGWYDSNRNVWVDVPEGWHHSGFVWNHPDACRWNDVFGISVEEYYESFERFGQHPPKWDDFIIEGMISAGWVRMGIIVNSMTVYVAGSHLRNCQKALRYYVKHVCPEDDIRFVVMSSQGGDFRGTVREMLLTSLGTLRINTPAEGA